MTLVTALFSPAPFQFIYRDVILHLDRTSCCTSQINLRFRILIHMFQIYKNVQGRFPPINRQCWQARDRCARERERERGLAQSLEWSRAGDDVATDGTQPLCDRPRADQLLTPRAQNVAAVDAHRAFFGKVFVADRTREGLCQGVALSLRRVHLSLHSCNLCAQYLVVAQFFLQSRAEISHLRRGRLALLSTTRLAVFSSREAMSAPD